MIYSALVEIEVEVGVELGNFCPFLEGVDGGFMAVQRSIHLDDNKKNVPKQGKNEKKRQP